MGRWGRLCGVGPLVRVPDGADDQGDMVRDVVMVLLLVGRDADEVESVPASLLGREIRPDLPPLTSPVVVLASGEGELHDGPRRGESRREGDSVDAREGRGEGRHVVGVVVLGERGEKSPGVERVEWRKIFSQTTRRSMKMIGRFYQSSRACDCDWAGSREMGRVMTRDVETRSVRGHWTISSSPPCRVTAKREDSDPSQEGNRPSGQAHLLQSTRVAVA